MPNSTEVQVGLCAHATCSGGALSVLLQVLGLAPGVCLVLGPVFPEVVHRVPALIGLGGISH